MKTYQRKETVLEVKWQKSCSNWDMCQTLILTVSIVECPTCVQNVS